MLCQCQNCSLTKLSFNHSMLVVSFHAQIYFRVVLGPLGQQKENNNLIALPKGIFGGPKTLPGVPKRCSRIHIGHLAISLHRGLWGQEFQLRHNFLDLSARSCVKVKVKSFLPPRIGSITELPQNIFLYHIGVFQGQEFQWLC